MAEDAKYESGTEARGPRHVFDGACGTCGALIPSGRWTCLVCGSRHGKASLLDEFPVPAPDGAGRGRADIAEQVHSPRRTPDIWRRWGGGVCAAILIVFAAISGFGIYRQYFDTSGYRAGETVVYESDGGRLMLSHPGLDQPKEIIGVERPSGGYGGGRLSAGATGRWLAYTSDSGGLYIIDLAWNGGSEQLAEARKLADGVSDSALFSKNGGYLTWLTDAGELYASDLSDVWKLDTGVTGVMAVGDRSVLYTRRGDSDRGMDLFLSELARDSGEWRLIDRGVVEVLDWTAGFSRIFYTSARQGEDGGEVTALQVFEQASGTSVIASGISRALDASADKATAYYLVQRDVEWTYDMFVDDDLASADMRMREPNIGDYPLVMEAYGIEDDGERAGEISLDGEMLSGEIPAGEEELDSADNEELIEQYNMYREELEAWENRLVRDDERRRLRDKLLDAKALPLYALYLYQNGQAVLLDDDVLDSEALGPEGGAVNAAKNYAAYHRLDLNSLVRMKMSQLWESPEMKTPDLARYFMLNTRQELRLSQQGGAPVRLMERAERISPKGWRVSPAGDGVYIEAGEIGGRADGGLLYYVPLKSGAAGDAVLVEREVADTGFAFRDGIIFRAGEDGGRIYFAQNGTARLLGGMDTLLLGQYGTAGTLLYLTDREGPDGAGTLRLLAREERIIASGVNGCAYYGDELLYLSKPGGGHDTADIYIWQGGRERLIERDARAVIGLAGSQDGGDYNVSSTGQ